MGDAAERDDSLEPWQGGNLRARNGLHVLISRGAAFHGGTQRTALVICNRENQPVGGIARYSPVARPNLVKLARRRSPAKSPVNGRRCDWRRAIPAPGRRSEPRIGIAEGWNRRIEPLGMAPSLLVAEILEPRAERTIPRRLHARSDIGEFFETRRPLLLRRWWRRHPLALAKLAFRRIAADLVAQIGKSMNWSVWRRNSSATIGGPVVSVDTTLVRRPLGLHGGDQRAEIAIA